MSDVSAYGTNQRDYIREDFWFICPSPLKLGHYFLEAEGEAACRERPGPHMAGPTRFALTEPERQIAFLTSSERAHKQKVWGMVSDRLLKYQ
jgi:hypothetical protein